MNALCRLPDRDFDDNIVFGEGYSSGGVNARQGTSPMFHNDHKSPISPQVTNHLDPPSKQFVRIHTAAQHLEFGMLAETGKQYMHG